MSNPNNDDFYADEYTDSEDSDYEGYIEDDDDTYQRGRARVGARYAHRYVNGELPEVDDSEGYDSEREYDRMMYRAGRTCGQDGYSG